MDIIVFSGQSNMQGQTECPVEDPVIDGVLEYKMHTDSLVPAVNPCGEDYKDYLLGADMGNGSLIPYYSAKHKELTGNDVLAVHAAKGATYVCDWLPSTESGHDRYNALIKKVNNAKNCAQKAGFKIENIYFIWLQGESDALKETTKDEYMSQLIELKNSLSSDLGINSFMIIEVGYFSSVVSWSQFCGNKKYDEIIMSAQEELCKSVEGFVMITDITKELSLNPEYLSPVAEGHFNNKAMKIIGEAAALGAYNHIISKNSN